MYIQIIKFDSWVPYDLSKIILENMQCGMIMRIRKLFILLFELDSQVGCAKACNLYSVDAEFWTGAK